MHHSDRRSEETPAEALARLVGELVDTVQTTAEVTRYRRVRRGPDRTIAVIDLTTHRTRAPGIIDQLHAIQAAAKTVAVDRYRWVRNDDDPCPSGTVCAHGRWVYLRTERRPAAPYGIVTIGDAIPQGSPGWDADGALSPMPSGKSFESRSPATAALELLLDIRAGVTELREQLGATTPQPSTKRGLRELVGLVLAVHEDDAHRVAGRVRSWVSTAKILLGYEAPIVALRDMYCRYCGGQLMVRADASSAVWCDGYVPIHGPAREGGTWPIDWVRCGASWPRGSWVALLDEMKGLSA
ncbi:hypothetical protein [Actinoallomurus iriomotensis]|uniref:Uncharacterized protein n=1 Tax=Actinoallomurus iriomotensis TaxID=478107 RepID=A0A9W6RU19_9ACTN|nr:hypothetical protein [Actinoallomurus iriomotensis]GLY81856.1 hypothetical protein Airi01_101230 [Actinoallomurus iriomotensis]